MLYDQDMGRLFTIDLLLSEILSHSIQYLSSSAGHQSPPKLVVITRVGGHSVEYRISLIGPGNIILNSSKAEVDAAVEYVAKCVPAPWG